MAYRRTGRAPGRPRGPVTADGKLEKARRALPHVKAFPEMRRAVDRSLRNPKACVTRLTVRDARDVDLDHRYTPAERGQALSFAWWVYVNRSTWSRAKLTAAITSLSPLMLFSSTFFAEMTGIPQDTATKHMIKSPDMEVKRVTGSCDIWVVHHLLELSVHGLDVYRQAVRELSISKGVPAAMLARISGVPVPVLKRPDRGVQFFPEKPDRIRGEICSQRSAEEFWEMDEEGKKNYDANPGDQHTIRDAFAGEDLGAIYTTSAPVPGEDDIPHYRVIPGLPSVHQASRYGHDFFRLTREWEERYQLPASPVLGPDVPSQRP